MEHDDMKRRLKHLALTYKETVFKLSSAKDGLFKHISQRLAFAILAVMVLAVVLVYFWCASRFFESPPTVSVPTKQELEELRLKKVIESLTVSEDKPASEEAIKNSTAPKKVVPSAEVLKSLTAPDKQ